jgi:hypothetical protein
MTRHLDPEEFVDALDGALSGARLEHLHGCDECRSELAMLAATAQEAGEAGVPEPSPLFWDHFSARVKQATLQEAPERSSWWAFTWKSVGAAAMLAAALAVAVYMKPANSPAPDAELAMIGASELPTIEPLPLIEDDGSWTLLVGLAAEAEWGDLRHLATPASGTADAIIEELTPAQREALARLLEKETGDF